MNVCVRLCDAPLQVYHLQSVKCGDNENKVSMKIKYRKETTKSLSLLLYIGLGPSGVKGFSNHRCFGHS